MDNLYIGDFYNKRIINKKEQNKLKPVTFN